MNDLSDDQSSGVNPACACPLLLFCRFFQRVAIGAATAKAKRNIAAKERAKAARKAGPGF